MAEPLPLPPLGYLQSRLRVDSAGRLFWLPREVRSATDASWNARFAGHEAGGDKGRGYRVVRVDGRLYLAHRIVLALASGEDPAASHVDHAAGVQQGDAPAGLRLATNAENVRNRTRLNRNNTSGVAGVHWHKAAGKWSAEIKVNRKKHHLGLFENIGVAAEARRAAERRFFGAFAPQEKIQ